jgi:GT2 family glycosyltransferase
MAKEIKVNRVSVIVPVYGDPEGLGICLTSLKKYYSNLDWVDVYFVNDCGPESKALKGLILNELDGVNNFYYHDNTSNLGFIKNVNNAAQNIVKDKKADILLLNSDTEVKEGAVEVLRELLHRHKELGAVNPRTNNATMFGGVSISVPLDASLAKRPKKAYRLFQKNIKSTDAHTVIPVMSGFCVLIRRSIIDKIGLLDEVYGKGYFDDNDMAMRINKLGYKCAVSNRAFVVHLGSTSFSDEYRIHRSAINQRIFLERYPDYFDFISKYPEVIYAPGHKKSSIVLRFAELLVKFLRYGSDQGYIKLLSRAYQLVASRLFGAKISVRMPMVQVWFHEISNTGAPLVMIDLIREWRKDLSFPENIGYFYPVHTKVDDDAMLQFMEDGITPAGKTSLDTNFAKGDVIILNSALPAWVYEKVLASLRAGIVKHAYFYIHENNDLFLVRHIDTLLKRNNDLINKDLITIYNPSQATVDGWKASVRLTKNIHVMSGRVKFDERMFKERSEKDFDSINFVSSGSSVPRKGYLSTVYAIICFYNSYYINDPSKYRNFSLNIWGIGEDDYFYNDFVRSAAKGLSSKIKLIPKTQSLGAVYDFFTKNNFNITYSIDETYSMVTMENMSFGYPIIRSEAPGMKEQLIPGVNGWLAPITDWWCLVEAIEEALNRDKTSNAKLKSMSDESIKIARKQFNKPYRLIDDYKQNVKK